MTRISSHFIQLLLLVLISGCSSGSIDRVIGTPTLFVITATLPFTSTPHPTDTRQPPTSVPTTAPVEGTTTTQVNVRSAPSASAEILGTVGIFVKVQILGKDAGGEWFEISYPPAGTQPSPSTGSVGVGWVAASYIQVAADADIQVLQGPQESLMTAVVTLGTEPQLPPSVVTISPSPLQLLPAPQDNDSIDSPAVDVTLSPAGSQSFTYSSDVSYPEGDAGDWVRFKPYAQVGQPTSISLVINCSGNAGLDLELLQNGVLLQTWQAVSCSQQNRLILNLFGGPPYTLHMSSAKTDPNLSYVGYTIDVRPGN